MHEKDDSLFFGAHRKDNSLNNATREVTRKWEHYQRIKFKLMDIQASQEDNLKKKILL